MCHELLPKEGKVLLYLHFITQYIKAVHGERDGVLQF